VPPSKPRPSPPAIAGGMGCDEVLGNSRRRRWVTTTAGAMKGTGSVRHLTGRRSRTSGRTVPHMCQINNALTFWSPAAAPAGLVQ
jgi:hypothetical protein